MEEQAVVPVFCTAIGHPTPMVGWASSSSPANLTSPSTSSSPAKPTKAAPSPPTSPPSPPPTLPSPSTTASHLPPPDYSTTSPHLETLALELLRLNNPDVHRAPRLHLRDPPRPGPRHRLLAPTPVGRARLASPLLLLQLVGNSLTAFLGLPVLHRTTTKSLKDLATGTVLRFPGVPP
ncbi:proline-rich protein 36-like [Eucalyptus grandis]|uniref:proline-rich protein 36-like n=1 Tax=Eucalyptus grandis TaxID=71139 RepID=UPI00192E82B2|nr:proline-rich protein 36-like [Eucalyptus grandis]